MTGAEITGIVLAIVSILQNWKVSRVDANQVRKQAVEALSNAVARTRQVVDRTAGKDVTDHELTHLWFTASLAFRQANEDELARLCQIKGEYWTQPENWTDLQVREAGIALQSMARELRRLLAES